MDCGKHWFAGLSGFACSHCGGGGGGRKSKPVSELPPPAPSVFDGVLVGVVDAVRKRFASSSQDPKSPLKRFVMEGLLAGAGYAAAGGSVEDAGAAGSSALTPDAASMVMMSRLMAAIAGGAEGLPPVPPELQGQMAEDPIAMMAMLSMMMGGMPADRDEEEDEEQETPEFVLEDEEEEGDDEFEEFEPCQWNANEEDAEDSQQWQVRLDFQ